MYRGSSSKGKSIKFIVYVLEKILEFVYEYFSVRDSKKRT